MWFEQGLRTVSTGGRFSSRDGTLRTGTDGRRQRGRAAVRQMLIAAAIAVALVGVWAVLLHVAA